MEKNEKEKLIKLLREELSDIDFWRQNYVFEEELAFEEIKQLENIIGNVWMFFYMKIKKLEEQNKYP